MLELNQGLILLPELSFEIRGFVYSLVWEWVFRYMFSVKLNVFSFFKFNSKEDGQKKNNCCVELLVINAFVNKKSNHKDHGCAVCSV